MLSCVGTVCYGMALGNECIAGHGIASISTQYTSGMDSGSWQALWMLVLLSMVHALDPFPVFLTLDAGLSMYRSCCYSTNAKLIVDRFRTRRSWYESDMRLAPCSEHDGGYDRSMSVSLVLESCADAQKGEGRD
jgi:hypothetical protein